MPSQLRRSRGSRARPAGRREGAGLGHHRDLPDRLRALVGDHRRVEGAGGLEQRQVGRLLFLGDRRHAPVCRERLVEDAGREGCTPAGGDVAQRHEAEPATLGSRDGALPAAHQLRAHGDAIVDEATFRLEAGILEKRVVVGRVRAQDARGKRAVRIDHERHVERPHAAAGGVRALGRQPGTGRIHQRTHRLSRARQRLELDDVAEPLVPVSLVARVDHGQDPGDDLPVVAHDERPDTPIGRHRTRPGHEGRLERRERRPERTVAGVHLIVEAHELLDRRRPLGNLDAHRPNPTPARDSRAMGNPRGA